MSIHITKLYMLYAMTILLIILVSACEVFAEEQYLTVRIPSIESSRSWSTQSTRTIFYLQKNTITSKNISLSSFDLSLPLEKSTVLPLLVCVDIEGEQSNMLQCPLAMGGVYPFDASEFSLVLSPLHKAQVAQLLLHLYEHGLQIQKLNVAKLYSSIESRSAGAPFDFSRFYDYLSRGSLSSWGIAPQTSYEVIIPNIQQKWISTSYWVDTIKYDSNFATHEAKLKIYPGKWIFVSDIKNEARAQHSRLYIFVDLEGNYSITTHN